MDEDHYFSPSPQTPSQPRWLEATLRGEAWRFKTDRGVFSYQHVDPGSKLLLEAMVIPLGARVLEVGAGYGPIGLVAARLAGPTGFATLVEVNQRAADLAVENAASNGVPNVRVIAAGEVAPEVVGPQDIVLSNPPIHAGWAVVDALLEKAAETLVPGGAMWLVGYKHKGLGSLKKRLGALLGPVETIDRRAGFHVLRAVREEGDA